MKNIIMIKYPLHLLPIFFMVFNVSLQAQNWWYRLNSPTSNNLNTLFFEDSLKGWVGGDSGLVLYTADGGNTWVQQQSNTDRDIIDIFFIDSNTGWAIAWSEGTLPFVSYILKTTDGGENWSVSQFRQENILMNSIYFLDSLNGFLGGNPGGIFKTSDGGVDWDSAAIAPAPYAYVPVNNFGFYDDKYGFACGGAHDIVGLTWKTIDGGDFWEPMNPNYAPPDDIFDIHFFDSLHVIGVGGDPDLFGVGIMRTTDAGLVWNYFEIGLIGIARAISFRTENEGWAPVPSPEALIQTIDYGYSWTVYTAPDSSAIYDLVFTDTLTGYAVGDEGVILKYKYPKVNSVESNEEIIKKDFVLFQNYPNPFNSVTSIKYMLSEDAFVSLIIYDALGNEVDRLLETYQPAGIYTEKWSADNHSTGMYYYQLTVGNYRESKKMILLR